MLGHLTDRPTTLVEPYAGGAGAGLILLHRGDINHLILGDTDPALMAFWECVLHHSERLLDFIATVPLTLDSWHHHRACLANPTAHDTLTLGCALLFINRTAVSGNITGGVIGGLNQTGKWKIDARFNRDTLARRCRTIADMAPHITLHTQDANTTITHYAHQPKTMLFIDPHTSPKAHACTPTPMTPTPTSP